MVQNEPSRPADQACAQPRQSRSIRPTAAPVMPIIGISDTLNNIPMGPCPEMKELREGGPSEEEAPRLGRSPVRMG